LRELPVTLVSLSPQPYGRVTAPLQFGAARPLPQVSSVRFGESEGFEEKKAPKDPSKHRVKTILSVAGLVVLLPIMGMALFAGMSLGGAALFIGLPLAIDYVKDSKAPWVMKAKKVVADYLHKPMQAMIGKYAAFHRDVLGSWSWIKDINTWEQQHKDNWDPEKLLERLKKKAAGGDDKHTDIIKKFKHWEGEAGVGFGLLRTAYSIFYKEHHANNILKLIMGHKELATAVRQGRIGKAIWILAKDPAARRTLIPKGTAGWFKAITHFARSYAIGWAGLKAVELMLHGLYDHRIRHTDDELAISKPKKPVGDTDAKT
jgi:hypothetical protein